MEFSTAKHSLRKMQGHEREIVNQLISLSQTVLQIASSALFKTLNSINQGKTFSCQDAEAIQGGHLFFSIDKSKSMRAIGTRSMDTETPSAI